MIEVLKQNKIIFLSYILLGFVLALVGGLLHLVASPMVLVEFLKYAVVAFYLLNIGLSLFIQRLPVYHPYVMFLGVFGLFILSRIFIDIIGGETWAKTSQFCHYVFDVGTQVSLLMVVVLSLFSLQVGSILANAKIFLNKEIELDLDVNWTNVALVLFYIGLPFMVYQFLMVGLEVVEHTYSARLSDNLVYRNSYIVTFMFRMSYCAFFVYLAGRPKSKYFYLHLAVFILASYLELLQGARFRVMGVSLVLFIYVMYYLRVKINLWGISGFVIFLIFVSAIIGGVRNGEKLSERQGWMLSFFVEQGIGIQIVGHSIENEDDIDFSFSQMFARLKMKSDLISYRIKGKPYCVDKIALLKKYGILSYQLTHSVNSEALRGGWDMSCSYLAELYSIGRFWAIIIGNLLIGFITCFLYEYLKNRRLGLLFLLFFLPYWLFIPRYNTFDFLKDNMTNFIFVLFILSMVYLYQYIHRLYRLKTGG